MPKQELSFDVIFSELKVKKYRSVYFLQGAEPLFIDLISNFIEKNCLPEDQKSFNQTVLYGKETDMGTIISAAKRFPMMHDKQVVIVKEAQEIKDLEKSVKIKSGGKDIEVNILEEYIKKSVPSTILVICYKYKTLDGRKSLAKNIEEYATVFNSKPLYDNQLPDWIKKHSKEVGLQISSTAASLLSEYIGNNLSRIANELEKISVNIPSGTLIEDKHITQFVGISKEYNVFELQNALSRKDILKANTIIQYFADNAKENPIQQLISTLFGFFNKLLLLKSKNIKDDQGVQNELNMRNPFAAKEYIFALNNYSDGKLFDVISYLRLADMQSKGYYGANYTEGEILKELVFKILH